MIRLNRSSLAAAAFAFAGLTSSFARAEGPVSLTVDQAQSQVAYTITHKLHTAVGTSKKSEGMVRVLPDGTVQVMVRAPVASFDSQNSGRDDHMRETMEATKYQFVVFKGVSKLTMPTTFPSTVKLNVQGELDFHGRKKPETVPVEVTFTSATEVKATSKFTVSLEKYEIDRPSLMLIKIDDACQIALDLVLKRQ